MSHPAWVRGLKLNLTLMGDFNISSHPAWVRGLKQSQNYHYLVQNHVAPRVGAWIETNLPVSGQSPDIVAPRVGAWIETHCAAAKSFESKCRTPRGCVD